MRRQNLLVAVVILLGAAPCLRAQCEARDSNFPVCLITHFPSLGALANSLKEMNGALPAEQLQSSPAGGGNPHIGRLAALEALGLDNIKLHADATYSDTLAKSLSTGGEALTPFQLTGVKFIPTLSLTYELNLGQLTKARRGWLSAQQVQQNRSARYETDLQKLEDAYLQFQVLRAQWLNAQDQRQDVRTAFYKLKAQAVDVLALAHYQTRVVDEWLVAEYPTPATQASLPTESASR